jgi:hypothetical protein
VLIVVDYPSEEAERIQVALEAILKSMANPSINETSTSDSHCNLTGESLDSHGEASSHVSRLSLIAADGWMNEDDIDFASTPRKEHGRETDSWSSPICDLSAISEGRSPETKAME